MQNGFEKAVSGEKQKQKLFQLQKLIYKHTIKVSESSVFFMSSFKTILYFNWNYSGWIYAFLCHLWQINVVLLWLKGFFSVCMRRERRKSTDFSSTQVKTNWEHFISTFILEKKDSKSLSIWSACWKWLFYFTINRKAFLHLRDKFQQILFSFMTTNCYTSCKINF